MFTQRIVLGLSAVALGLSLVQRVSAEVSAAAFVGTSLSGEPGDDLMGVDYGLRVGYALQIPIYLGAAASIQQGTRDDEPGAPFNRMSYYGAESSPHQPNAERDAATEPFHLEPGPPRPQALAGLLLPYPTA
jgi:hypothetical protein